MSEISSKNVDVSSKNSSRASQMTPAAEARLLILDIAGPMPVGSKVKAVLSDVASKTDFGFRRIKSLYSGEARRIDSIEMDALRRMAECERRAREEAKDRAEYEELRDRLARMEQRMAEMAAQLAGPQDPAASPKPAGESPAAGPLAGERQAMTGEGSSRD